MKAYFSHIYQAVSSIMIGMGITGRHMFQKPVTIQYPEQRLQLPERERNRLFVNMEDCIGCDQCAKACPVNCIELKTIKAVPGDIVGKTGLTSKGKKKALFVPTFTIDFAKCCYCQLCVFPCPTECIFMTDVFEFSDFKRAGLKYEFSDMTTEQTAEKKMKAEDFAMEQAKKKEEVAKTAASSQSSSAALKKAAETKKSDIPPSQTEDNKNKEV